MLPRTRTRRGLALRVLARHVKRSNARLWSNGYLFFEKLLQSANSGGLKYKE